MALRSAFPLLLVTLVMHAVAVARATAAAPTDGGEQQPLPISSTGCTLLAPYALITAGAARITDSHINGSVAVGGAAKPVLPAGRGLLVAAATSAAAVCEEPVARCTTEVGAGGSVITLRATGTTNDVQCEVGAAALARARTVRLVGPAPAALFVVLLGGGGRRRLRLDRLRVEGVAPERTVWVPCGVERMRLTGVELVGTLFAPTVDVVAARSSVLGGVTARSLVARRVALGGARFDCAVVVPGREA